MKKTKPPICFICKKRFDDFEEAGLISFRKTDSDRKWEKEMKETGKVGHPPYAEWFCQEHYPIAKKYTHLSKKNALKKIQAELKKD